jgi:hypothetical protein
VNRGLLGTGDDARHSHGVRHRRLHRSHSSHKTQVRLEIGVQPGIFLGAFNFTPREGSLIVKPSTSPDTTQERGEGSRTDAQARHQRNCQTHFLFLFPNVFQLLEVMYLRLKAGPYLQSRIRSYLAGGKKKPRPFRAKRGTPSELSLIRSPDLRNFQKRAETRPVCVSIPSVRRGIQYELDISSEAVGFPARSPVRSGSHVT